MSFTIFQRKLIGTTVQLLTENLNVFNEASGGTMLIGSGEVIKETMEKMTIGIIDGLVQDRNEHAPVNTVVQPKVLSRILGGSINSAGRLGPVAITSGQLRLIETDVNRAAAEIATLASEAMLKRYVTVAMGAGVAAIEAFGQGIYTQDAHVTSKAGELYPTVEDFPLAASIFGDQADLIRTWFMSGTQWAKFSAREAVKSAKLVFELGNMKIFSDGFGRSFVVSDAASAGISAATSGGSAIYAPDQAIVGLASNAIQVTTTGLKMAADPAKLGGENIESWWQGEFNYSIALKGMRPTMAFRTATEGKKTPTMADLVKKENWEAEKGETDRKPVGNDADPVVPTRNVRETLGIIMKLTPTTIPVADAGV